MSKIDLIRSPCEKICMGYSDEHIAQNSEIAKCYENLYNLMIEYNLNRVHYIVGNETTPFLTVMISIIIVFSAAISVLILTDSSLSHPFKLYGF